MKYKSPRSPSLVPINLSFVHTLFRTERFSIFIRFHCPWSLLFGCFNLFTFCLFFIHFLASIFLSLWIVFRYFSYFYFPVSLSPFAVSVLICFLCPSAVHFMSRCITFSKLKVLHSIVLSLSLTHNSPTLQLPLFLFEFWAVPNLNTYLVSFQMRAMVKVRERERERGMHVTRIFVILRRSLSLIFIQWLYISPSLSFFLQKHFIPQTRSIPFYFTFSLTHTPSHTHTLILTKTLSLTHFVFHSPKHNFFFSPKPTFLLPQIWSAQTV